MDLKDNLMVGNGIREAFNELSENSEVHKF